MELRWHFRTCVYYDKNKLFFSWVGVCLFFIEPVLGNNHKSPAHYDQGHRKFKRVHKIRDGYIAFFVLLWSCVTFGIPFLFGVDVRNNEKTSLNMLLGLCCTLSLASSHASCVLLTMQRTAWIVVTDGSRGIPLTLRGNGNVFMTVLFCGSLFWIAEVWPFSGH